MKLTKSILKALIKEELEQTNDIDLDELSVYRDVHSRNLSPRQNRALENLYKSMVMYNKRVQEDYIVNDPDAYEREIHYLLKTADDLEKFVLAREGFKDEVIGGFMLKVVSAARKKYQR